MYMIFYIVRAYVLVRSCILRGGGVSVFRGGATDKFVLTVFQYTTRPPPQPRAV